MTEMNNVPYASSLLFSWGDTGIQRQRNTRTYNWEVLWRNRVYFTGTSNTTQDIKQSNLGETLLDPLYYFTLAVFLWNEVVATQQSLMYFLRCILFQVQTKCVLNPQLCQHSHISGFSSSQRWSQHSLWIRSWAGSMVAAVGCHGLDLPTLVSSRWIPIGFLVLNGHCHPAGFRTKTTTYGRFRFS